MDDDPLLAAILGGCVVLVLTTYFPRTMLTLIALVAVGAVVLYFDTKNGRIRDRLAQENAARTASELAAVGNKHYEPRLSRRQRGHWRLLNCSPPV